MTLASIIATGIAWGFNLDAPLTAGILAILSIQLTRTDSVMLAGKRLLCTLLALSLSTVFFHVLGYDFSTYFLFTFVFIALSFLFGIHPGIVPSLVLVTHLLNHGSFSWSVLINALVLMLIALLIAITLNMLYPLNTKKALARYNHAIDRNVRNALTLIGQFLLHEINHKTLHEKHQILSEELETIILQAEMIEKDILFDKSRDATEYLKMRRIQINRLERIVELCENLKQKHPYAKAIGNYIIALTHDIGKANRATYQGINLQTLLVTYRKKALPETREAFETRAVLYQIIFELQGFLQVKINYHKKLY